MWICLNNAFLSIVADRKDPNKLLVRARRKGDIEEVFGAEAKVYTKLGADYAYRANLSREFVAIVIGTNVRYIRYDNFKDSVKDDALHNAYMDFWVIMHRLQARMRRFKAKKAKKLPA